ncbi:hypothetical protein LTR56_018454 [Elasticomyces elasticus]|nr:hypothetical protein LTR56_018454 [Elasticomyces elasticus]KAK3631710.1 hypothetical protein LTR22_020948 [Elasticomyces elasticus]KAK4908398.1 hypothetical protein LTR49_022711 [Elasticomyces elasticus]KAK5751726.1 hypothetical protein LTS12_018201 [Elasticomyces elasticus]
MATADSPPKILVARIEFVYGNEHAGRGLIRLIDYENLKAFLYRLEMKTAYMVKGQMGPLLVTMVSLDDFHGLKCLNLEREHDEDWDLLQS